MPIDFTSQLYADSAWTGPGATHERLLFPARVRTQELDRSVWLWCSKRTGTHGIGNEPEWMTGFFLQRKGEKSWAWNGRWRRPHVAGTSTCV